MSLRNRLLLGALVLVLGASGCVHHSPMPLPEELRAATGEDVQTWVVVDPDRDEVLIFAGPFHVPAAPSAGEHVHGEHDHANMGRTPMIDFRWPVEAWMRGFRLSMPYSEMGDADPVEVFPFYADVNNHVGDVTSFDLPPGETVRSYEFTVPASGRIVAAGGHLHDYGVDLEFQDAKAGERLFRLKGKRDGDGRMKSVEQKVFGIRHGTMFLKAGHRYRVVGRYFNPTDRTLRNAAMAHIFGIFAPDDPEQ